MPAITGQNGKIMRKKQVAATQVLIANGATTEVTATRFQITDGAKRTIVRSSAFTVKVGAATMTFGTDYTLETISGFIVFAASQTGETVTIGYYYWELLVTSEFYKWSLDLGQDTPEITDFQSAGWKTFGFGIKESSGSAEAYWTPSVNAFRVDIMPTPVLFYLAADKWYEGYAIIKGMKEETPADELITSSIDFTFTGPVYYRS